ncbi:hypothetical protein BAUCODRAFT_263832 [Baudoinia panamericana UAMH 10762]|uniref:Uncharacterized protein n=1 Tax=Baudoinia panamericana (strain UAMH 10762) TaxID=717646 RepID=M2LFM1_BAUPA|nr:uncharacterized protein BAUCODRAFT_263832 [Baudoinia panamericana UAMH 10762]EMC92842.1 hypothetical protein BAUCODRAFT_263832 [Baudoinia panamericana UAMH 10762]
MNFAPYQSDAPEEERAKSPPARSPHNTPRPDQQSQAPHNISSVAAGEDPWAAARNQRLPPPSQYYDDEEEAGGYEDVESQRFRNDYIGQQALQGGGVTYNGGGNIFETSLRLPLGVEAALAYILLPPAGGMVLLLIEHKSDYVRFHAWQSALLFSALFMVHIIFSWTAVISYMLLACDILLIFWLAYGAWRNSETLDRVEVPFFGRLASSFVDDE